MFYIFHYYITPRNVHQSSTFQQVLADWQYFCEAGLENYPGMVHLTFIDNNFVNKNTEGVFVSPYKEEEKQPST